MVKSCNNCYEILIYEGVDVCPECIKRNLILGDKKVVVIDGTGKK